MDIARVLTRSINARGIALSAILAVSTATFAQNDDGAVGDDAAEPYIRVQEDERGNVSLEVAARTFERRDADGPAVCLVSVAHIGDAELYDSIEKILSEYDVVLFESVMPPGAKGVTGETDEERIEGTKLAMRFVATFIEQHSAETGAYPKDLAALAEHTADADSRMGHWLKSAQTDGWGHELRYEATEPGFTLISLGADGSLGGEDSAADIDFADETPISADEMGADDGLQAKLADALNLEFQLVAVSYDHDNWRCSDLAMDELQREFKQRDLSFEEFGGTLAGSSLPAKLISAILKMIRVADALLDGAVSEGFKIVMIEMLGDETITEVAMAQFGEGFKDVILNERNQVVIDDLKNIVNNEPDVESVAIFYGAAHMPDLAERLYDQLGYVPADTTWIPAITVDIAKSGMSPGTIAQLRAMVRTAMKRTIKQMQNQR